MDDAQPVADANSVVDEGVERGDRFARVAVQVEGRGLGGGAVSVAVLVARLRTGPPAQLLRVHSIVRPLIAIVTRPPLRNARTTPVPMPRMWTMSPTLKGIRGSDAESLSESFSPIYWSKRPF